jgi:hypothetical protein
MENIFFDFYSQPGPSVTRFFKGHGLMGSMTRFAIPLLKTVVPIVMGTVSDYFSKDISFTQAISDNLTINKLKRKLIDNHHGNDHRRQIRARSV